MPRFLTAGESHGQAIIGLIESFPAGFTISVKAINNQLTRRRKGFGRGGRMRIERDRVTILGGLRHGRTLGSPIICLIENRDWPNWKKVMAPVELPMGRLSPSDKKRLDPMTAPRPGHADLAGMIKYSTGDIRDVLERASARETAARTAIGAIARQFLEHFDIRIASHVVAVGKVGIVRKNISFEEIMESGDASPVRCVDKTTERKMIDLIRRVKKAGDTLGGIFEVRVTGLPIGLGSNAQWYQRLDSRLAGAMMSIQSVKGVEIGAALTNSRKIGSRVHDRIYFEGGNVAGRLKGLSRRTNAAGGIEGGMSNGSDIIIRAACKPIATLRKGLETVDIASREKRPAVVERADVCVVPAAAVVGEAMAAMVIADAFMEKFGGDNRAEIETAYRTWLEQSL